MTISRLETKSKESIASASRRKSLYVRPWKRQLRIDNLQLEHNPGKELTSRSLRLPSRIKDCAGPNPTHTLALDHPSIGAMYPFPMFDLRAVCCLRQP